MKFYKHCFLGLAMAALVASCSDDKNGGGEPTLPEAGEAVYMGLTVQMPSASGRSQTTTPGQSTDGTEVGTADENNVGEVAIVIAKASDNSYIVSGMVQSGALTAIPADNSYKTVAKLQKTNLSDYYNDKTNFSQEVNVFVFCNPTATLKTTLNNTALGNTSWYDEICEVNNGIWTAKTFLMSNFEIATRKLPATFDAWDSHKTPATAFDLSGLNNGGQSTEVDNSAANGLTGAKLGGAIKVHRSVARFDYADGSAYAGTVTPNTYDVVTTKVDGATKTLIQVSLGKIAVANLAKNFFYLHRVSDDGQPLGTNYALLGAETPTNYIVGPYAENFKSSITSGFDTYFTQPFFNNDGGYNNNNWDTKLISEVLGSTQDNYESTADYRIWRYIPENVIPKDNSNQKKGITTTVIFKGKMVASDYALNSADPTIKTMAETINNVGDKLTGDPSKDPILYSFNGNLYLTWTEVRKAAIAASVEMKDGVIDADETGNIKSKISRNNALYIAVFGNGGMGTFKWGEKEYTDSEKPGLDPESANVAWNAWDVAKKAATEDNPNEDAIAAALSAMRNKVTDAGFTIYQSSADTQLGGAGYYCYYFYYNRHNDNLKPGTMGPMEFAVVRNNVYKLSVTKISKLGHPRTPENDPDSPKPDDPDESDDIYFTVTCRVLPWVVRVNDIEF